MQKRERRERLLRNSSIPIIPRRLAESTRISHCPFLFIKMKPDGERVTVRARLGPATAIRQKLEFFQKVAAPPRGSTSIISRLFENFSKS